MKSVKVRRGGVEVLGPMDRAQCSRVFGRLGVMQCEKVGKGTVFLSGKITGDFDFMKKFGSASQALTLAGFTVIDPSILPSSGFAWDAYMRMTLAMINECDAVCFLPDWRDSRGAVWEYGQAVASGKSIFFYKDWLMKRVEKESFADGSDM